MEVEQWVTYRNGKAQGSFTRWDLRNEFEYGILDDLQTAFYVNYTHEHQEGVEDLDGNGSVDQFDHDNNWVWKGVSSEWVYQIFSPYTDWVGVALYFEGTVSDTEGELEQKLILSKNIGDWVLAFNAVVEQEWDLETSNNDVEGKFEMDWGVAYKIIPEFSLGLEAKNQRVYPENFRFEEHSVWFVGPNLHYGNAAGWWVTATFMPQVAGWPDQGGGRNFDDNERFEARLIAGYNF